MTSAANPATPAPPGALAWLRYTAGHALLAVCLVASLMLSTQHIGLWRLPGCTQFSGCAQLAHSPWGNVLGWPVAFLGAGWFAGLWAAYALSSWRSGWPALLRWGVRLGALASVGFIAIMLYEQEFCPYCLVVHVCNLAFWGLLEIGGTARQPVHVQVIVGAAAFLGVAFVLGSWAAAVRRDVTNKAELEFQRSLDQIIAEIHRQRKLPADAAEADGHSPLKTRWRRGPEAAHLRLVMFGDYECQHCKEIERQIDKALKTSGSDLTLSFSLKHYPMCKQCNRQILDVGMHPRACRAAQAVEAAGIVGGNDAWWKMHDWLMQRSGGFTDEQLRESLPDFGIKDADAYFAAFAGDDALRRVKDDIEDGARLGVDSTPLLFVNGVELSNVTLANSVFRAIQTLAEAKPAPRTEAVDRPRPGDQRLAAVWAADKQFDVERYKGRWTLGPADVRHRVVLMICHENEYSAPFSRAARKLAAERDDVRVEFWHFPLTKRFNDAITRSPDKDRPQSYRMALLAEAAGRAGGNDAFWKMHEWLLAQPRNLANAEAEAATVAAAAEELKLDHARLLAELGSDATRQAVEADITAAAAAGVRGAPNIFIGGRLVPGPEPTVAAMQAILRRPEIVAR